MTDPVRIGLFALSVGVVLASSLLLVSPLRLGGVGTLLALWVVGTGQVVLLAEVLSLLHALDWPGFLAGHLLIVGGTAVWARRRPAADRWRAAREIRISLERLRPLVWGWDAPALPILASAVLLTGSIGAVQALWVPPKSSDVLVYHMSRVGYYLQFRSLDFYPTDEWRQVAYPANAELLILWTVAFLRADWLANAVQLTAWAVSTMAVYGLGRQIGLAPRAALFGAGLFALLPQAVLQSTNAKNDLVLTSFVAASLYFLLRASGQWAVGSGQERPSTAHSLLLAGAAAGLALGTKGTALLAVPGLTAVTLILFGRRLEWRVIAGAALGSVAAVLLGSYIYVQNWFVYGSAIGGFPIGPVPMGTPESLVVPWGGFIANLARTLFQFAFADLSGPLADPRARPLSDALIQVRAEVGERLFGALGIPSAYPLDVPWWPKFSFVHPIRVQEMDSGVGLIGSLIVVVAAATLVWPRRLPLDRRLLALAALSYLAAMALTLRWNPFGGGRFLLTVCALAAPLLGAPPPAIPRPWLQRLALVLATWSAITGVYTAWFNQDKPVLRLAGQDRPGLMFLNLPPAQAYFREVDLELGPTTVAMFGDFGPASGRTSQWEYPYFGPRFGRTLVPLVAPGYAERWGLKRPPAWSNKDLMANERPTYIAVESRRSGAEALPEIIPGRCFEVPLRHGKPAVPWELWRCEDRDPRSLLENGDFDAWTEPGAESGVLPSALSTQRSPLPIGWEVGGAGEARLSVDRLNLGVHEGEPFRARLAYRSGGDSHGQGGIVQEVPLAELRGRLLVVDARVQANRKEAALLWVDDGVRVFEATNATTAAETLRVEHPVDPRATSLRVGLDAGKAGQDAVVLVRTILAIPR